MLKSKTLRLLALFAICMGSAACATRAGINPQIGFNDTQTGTEGNTQKKEAKEGPLPDCGSGWAITGRGFPLLLSCRLQLR